MRLRPLKSRWRPRGLTTAPESRCEPGCLPFSSTATGTSPSRSAVSGSSSTSWPRRIAQASPAGPAPTTRIPTSIGSASRRDGERVLRLERRREPGGDRAHQLALPRADELGQLRDDLVQVADDAEVAELEDGCVRVLVDRDDHVRALHAHLVLDCTGDPAGNVELRRDGLAGLADLGRVRVPARVDDRARRGDRAAERLRQFLHQSKILRAAEATAAGDDDVGVLDRRAALLLVRLLEHRRLRREVLELDRELGDLGLARVAVDGLERAGTDQREPGLALPADLDVDRVAEGRPRPDERAVPLLEVDEVPVQAGVEPGGEAGRDIGRRARTRRRAPCRSRLPSTTCSSTSTRGCGRGASRAGSSATQTLPAPWALPASARDPGARDHAVGVAERRRLGQHAERALLDLAVVVLEEDEGRHAQDLRSSYELLLQRGSRGSAARRCRRPRSCGCRRAAAGRSGASTSVFEPASPIASAAERRARRA